MAIAGSGTQSDPYLPETWEEILQCTTADSKYTVFPSGVVFNMNEYYPDGMPSAIPFRGFIDGNGCTIKNAYYTGDNCAFLMSNAEGKGKIKNLNFLDFYLRAMATSTTLIGLTSSAVEHVQYSGESFYNCKFSGIIDVVSGNYAAITKGGYTASIANCSYNVKAMGKIISLDTGQFTALIKNSRIAYEGVGVGIELHIDNCYVTGAMAHCDVYSRQGGVSNTSILNIETSEIKTVQYTAPTTILVNSDKYSGSLSSGYIGVTDAQLKDPTYLSSIGFPIGGGS